MCFVEIFFFKILDRYWSFLNLCWCWRISLREKTEPGSLGRIFALDCYLLCRFWMDRNQTGQGGSCLAGSTPCEVGIPNGCHGNVKFQCMTEPGSLRHFGDGARQPQTFWWRSQAALDTFKKEPETDIDLICAVLCLKSVPSILIKADLDMTLLCASCSSYSHPQVVFLLSYVITQARKCL